LPSLNEPDALPAISEWTPDLLSGGFFGIGDDLDELLRRSGEITARELYTLRLNV